MGTAVATQGRIDVLEEEVLIVKQPIVLPPFYVLSLYYLNVFAIPCSVMLFFKYYCFVVLVFFLISI